MPDQLDELLRGLPSLKATGEPATADELPEWEAFGDDSGSLGIPRAAMPQIKSAHRGAMVQYLKGRGIAHSQEDVTAGSLKPTQAEYSPAKVEKAKGFEGTPRSILISADDHVLDGHHQWLADRDKDPAAPVKAIRLHAPIKQLVLEAARFPSSGVDESSAPGVSPVTTVGHTPSHSQEGKPPAPQQRDALDDLLDGLPPVKTAPKKVAPRRATPAARADAPAPGDALPKPVPGPSRVRGLEEFVTSSGFEVSDGYAASGHNPGSLHGAGWAVDVRTRDKKPEEVEDFMRRAREAGYVVRDERVRPRGQGKWTGPHVHLEYDPLGKVLSDLPEVDPLDALIAETPGAAVKSGLSLGRPEAAATAELSGASDRVESVDDSDPRDVSVTLKGGVRVRVGKEDYANRLRLALEVLDARGDQEFVDYVDVSDGSRAVVGLRDLHAGASPEDYGEPVRVESAETPFRSSPSDLSPRARLPAEGGRVKVRVGLSKDDTPETALSRGLEQSAASAGLSVEDRGAFLDEALSYLRARGVTSTRVAGTDDAVSAEQFARDVARGFTDFHLDDPAVVAMLNRRIKPDAAQQKFLEGLKPETAAEYFLNPTRSAGEKFAAVAAPVVSKTARGLDLATRPVQAASAGFWAKMRGVSDPLAAHAAYQEFFGEDPELGRNIIAEGLRDSGRLKEINPRLPGLLAELAEVVADPANLIPGGVVAGALKKTGRGARILNKLEDVATLGGHINPRPLGIERASLIPETAETLGAQLDALRAGRRAVVEVTPDDLVNVDTKFVRPHGMRSFKTFDGGRIVYNPKLVTREEVVARMDDGTLGELLGHVEPKSERTTHTVVARDPATGGEIQASAVSPENVGLQAAELARQHPGAVIESGGEDLARDVLAERVAGSGGLDAAREPVTFSIGGVRRTGEVFPLDARDLEALAGRGLDPKEWARVRDGEDFSELLHREAYDIRPAPRFGEVLRYGGRDVVVVEMPDGAAQPFYRSSGRNSKQAGRWFPFDGAKRLPDGPWFDKGKYVAGELEDAAHPLHRFGSDDLRAVSDDLGRVEIPAGREVADIEELNRLLVSSAPPAPDPGDALDDLLDGLPVAAAQTGERGAVSSSLLTDAPDVLKSMFASVDASAAGRQAFFPLLTDTRRTLKGLAEGFPSLSKRRHIQFVGKLKTHPLVDEAEHMGLALDSLAGKRNEFFPSEIAERIPGYGTHLIAPSNRLMTAQLDAVRIRNYESWTKPLREAGMTAGTHPEEFAQVAELINVLSGRASLGKVGTAIHPVTRPVIFSPKLLKSRFTVLNPLTYARLKPAVRRVAAKKAGKLAVKFGGLLGMAALVADEVGIDPRKGNFGKVRFGDTTYDITGGESSKIRFVFNLAQSVGVTAGKYRKGEKIKFEETPPGVAAHFLRSQLAPAYSLIPDAVTGETYDGREFTWTEGMLRRVAPGFAQDVYDGFTEGDGAAGALKTLPAFFGVATRTRDREKMKEEWAAASKAAKKAKREEATEKVLERMPDSARDELKLLRVNLWESDAARADEIARMVEQVVEEPGYKKNGDDYRRERMRAAIEVAREQAAGGAEALKEERREAKTAKRFEGAKDSERIQVTGDVGRELERLGVVVDPILDGYKVGSVVDGSVAFREEEHPYSYAGQRPEHLAEWRRKVAAEIEARGRLVMTEPGYQKNGDDYKRDRLRFVIRDSAKLVGNEGRRHTRVREWESLDGVREYQKRLEGRAPQPKPGERVRL